MFRLLFAFVARSTAPRQSAGIAFTRVLDRIAVRPTTDGVAWSVCVCVCLLVTFVSPAKNGWTDQDADWRV